ncbi:hypothetical protein FOA52_015233 [Chlamydomonas sp. UWO 241]|nr:hypothetical protein FOA52_015233 [Chlamydomonas sp. UWO 241]
MMSAPGSATMILTGLAQHLSLRGALGARTGAWGGLVLQELQQAQQQCDRGIASTSGRDGGGGGSRGISTSAAQCARRGFQSVLSKPVPKAISLHKGNFMMWKAAGFDVGAAETILQQAYYERWQRSTEAQAARLQSQAARLMARAATVVELSTVASELAPHLAPPVLVSAVARATALPVALTREAALSAGPRALPRLLDDLLPRLSPHAGALTTGQLAAVLAACGRAREAVGYAIPPGVAADLRKELDGDVGQARVDAAGPRDTAALMSAVARLGWGSTQLWEALGEAALAQLADMSDVDAVSCLRAAACCRPARASESCGPRSLLWVHAEATLLKRQAAAAAAAAAAAGGGRGGGIAGGERGMAPEHAAAALHAFVASGTPEGVHLRSAIEASLATGPGGSWRTAPPRALLDAARASATLMARQPGHGGASSLLQHTVAAAGLSITRFTTRELASLLRALHEAYRGAFVTALILGVARLPVTGVGRSSGRDARGAAPPPRGVQALFGLAAQLLAIRGLQRNAPSGSDIPGAAQLHGGDGGDGSAALLALVRCWALVGSSGGAGGGGGGALAAALAALAPPACEMLASGQLPPRAAADLLQAYAAAGPASPPGALAALAAAASATLAQRAGELAPRDAAAALLALATASNSGEPQAAGEGVAAAATTSPVVVVAPADARAALADHLASCDLGAALDGGRGGGGGVSARELSAALRDVGLGGHPLARLLQGRQ